MHELADYLLPCKKQNLQKIYIFMKDPVVLLKFEITSAILKVAIVIKVGKGSLSLSPSIL